MKFVNLLHLERILQLYSTSSSGRSLCLDSIAFAFILQSIALIILHLSYVIKPLVSLLPSQEHFLRVATNKIG